MKNNYGDCPSFCPNDKPDVQEEVRRKLVKESCKVKNGNKGVCVTTNKCKSVSNPKRGSCSNKSEVCCYYEKPVGSSDKLVNAALSKQSVSYGKSYYQFLNQSRKKLIYRVS